MRRMSGMLAAIALVAGSALGWGSSNIRAENADYTVVKDLETFKAHFIGPKIMDPKDSANYFVVNEDGSISGSWFGKEMAGEWRWEDGYFCRSLSAPRAAPEDCQEWSHSAGKARLVRNRGTGDPTDYALEE